MALSKSLAAFSSKLRSKVARKSSSKIITISAPYSVSKSMSPALEQMYDDKLFAIELCNPSAPPRQPAFPIKHKVQLPSLEAEQPQPATSLSAQQAQVDLPSPASELSNTSTCSDDAPPEDRHGKDVLRCSTPSEQLFSPSAPASPNASSRSSRTPSPIFDSVTTFEIVDSTTPLTISEDRFTELPPRIFPLRRTARAEHRVVATSTVKESTTTTSDPFATLFSGPSPSSSTHSLASLASFGDRLPLVKDIESGLARIGCVNKHSLTATDTGLDTLFAGASPSNSVSSLAALAFADCASLEQDVKMGVASIGKFSSYRSRALPATLIVEHEGCFAIVEDW